MRLKTINLLPCKQLNITFQATRIYDINLLTINSLCFLLFGQYPGINFNKHFAKYKKSKIKFILSFNKKKICYLLFKLLYLANARQSDFTGYLYKNVYLLYPQQQIIFPIKTLYLFYMVDFLYGQQEKSILKVRQKLTLNIECLFSLEQETMSLDFLTIMNLPFYLENLTPQSRLDNNINVFTKNL